jgi:putative alpha-1,2-mannosidase
MRHDEIMAGGELEFIMGSEPNKTWASAPAARPGSMTKQ